jgi:hypothetical protein
VRAQAVETFFNSLPGLLRNRFLRSGHVDPSEETLRRAAFATVLRGSQPEERPQVSLTVSRQGSASVRSLLVADWRDALFSKRRQVPTMRGRQLAGSFR